MSINFGPYETSLVPSSPSDVQVTHWDGSSAALASPITLDARGRVSFAVEEPGKYRIRVTRYPDVSNDTVSITEGAPYDPTDLRSYIDHKTRSSGGGVSDHGSLSGLGNDDHPQYLTEGRADLIYSRNGSTDPTTTTLEAVNGFGTIELASIARIIRFDVSSACRVRIYRSTEQRSADIARPFTTIPVEDQVLSDHNFIDSGTFWANPVYTIVRDGSTFFYNITGGPADITITWQEIPS